MSHYKQRCLYVSGQWAPSLHAPQTLHVNTRLYCVIQGVILYMRTHMLDSVADSGTRYTVQVQVLVPDPRPCGRVGRERLQYQ